MKIEKKHFLPTIVLVLICLAVSALLATVDLMTKDVIAENDRLALENSLKEALPGKGYAEMPINEGMTAAVTRTTDQKVTLTHVYRETSGEGYVVTLENSSGYTGKPIAVTVGVRFDGSIVKIIITQNPETKITKEIQVFPSCMEGMSLSDLRDMDLVAGVTYSSKALRESAAVASAVVSAVIATTSSVIE